MSIPLLLKSIDEATAGCSCRTSSGICSKCTQMRHDDLFCINCTNYDRLLYLAKHKIMIRGNHLSTDDMIDIIRDIFPDEKIEFGESLDGIPYTSLVFIDAKAPTGNCPHYEHARVSSYSLYKESLIAVLTQAIEMGS